MSWDRDKERKAAKNMSIASCVFGILFLLVWCAIAPSFMKLFGLFGLGMMIYRLYLCIQLAKEEKAPKEELEPWDRPSISSASSPETPVSSGKFCPYCGFQLQQGYEFCPKCGRRQP